MFKQLKIIFLLIIFIFLTSFNKFERFYIIKSINTEYKIQSIQKDYYIYKIERNLTKFQKYKFKLLCEKNEVNYENLMLSIYLETKGNINAINKLTNATGLIQILPINKISNNICEIDRIFIYLLKFKNIKNISNNFISLQIIIFYPYALSQSFDYIIGSEKGDEFAKLVAQQNFPYDLNNDGYIFKYELVQYLKNFKNKYTNN